MTTAAPEKKASPRRPLRCATDPREHGLTQEKFDEFYVDCRLPGGIVRREHCASECDDFREAECPLAGDDVHAKGGGQTTASPLSAVPPTGAAPDQRECTMNSDLTTLREEHAGGDDGESAVAPSAVANEDPAEHVAEAASDPADGDDAPEMAVELTDPAVEPAGEGDAAEGLNSDEGARAAPEEPDDTPASPSTDLVDTDDVVVQVATPARVNRDASGGLDLWTQALLEAGVEDDVGTAADATPGHIESWHQRTEKLGRMTAATACVLGLALIERKDALHHGEFQTWIEENCSFSYPRAAVYMKTARKLRQNNRTRDFCLAGMSIRELDKLLPSPPRKKTASKKGDIENRAPTSLVESAVPADTENAPSPATTPAVVANQTEEAAPAVADVSVDTSKTADEDEAEVEVEEETTVHSTDDDPAQPERHHDVEAALAALVVEIETSSDRQTRAVELIERLAASAGIQVSRRGHLIAVRPAAPKTTSASPRPRVRALRYHDLTLGHGASSTGSAAG